MSKKRQAISLPKGTYNVWTEHFTSLLGTMSDAKVAALMSITDTAVNVKRRKLGIPSFGKSTLQSKHKWTKAELAMFKSMNDHQIGKALGLDNTTVHRQRLRMGMLPKKRSPLAHVWTKKELSMLGKINDVQYALKFKMSRRQVKEKRYELGIPAANSKQIDQKWDPKWEKWMAKLSDKQVADKFGVSAARVRTRRLTLGIPSCSGLHRFAYTKKLVLELIESTDEAFAKKHKLDLYLVRSKRARLMHRISQQKR
jgi:hypothetical protein